MKNNAWNNKLLFDTLISFCSFVNNSQIFGRCLRKNGVRFGFCFQRITTVERTFVNHFVEAGIYIFTYMYVCIYEYIFIYLHYIKYFACIYVVLFILFYVHKYFFFLNIYKFVRATDIDVSNKLEPFS